LVHIFPAIMPMGEPDSYEVYFSEALGRWNIAEVMYDADLAVSHARRIGTEAGVIGTRVVWSRYDPTTEAFIERTVYRSAKPGTETDEDSNAGDDAQVGCRHGGHLYRPEGRKSIQHVLAAELERRCLTVIELLHDYGHARSIGDSGNLLQASVQRHAIECGRAGGPPVAARIRQIYDIVNDALQSLHGLSRATNRPALSEGGLGAVTAEWIDRLDGQRMIFSALACYLRPAKRWDEKLSLLARALSSPPTPAELPFVDELASEVLRARGGLATAIGGERRGALAVRVLIALVDGECSPDLAMPALAELLRAAGGIARLPVLRATLMQRARRIVDVALALGDGSVPDELRQLHALWRIVQGTAQDNPLRRLLPALEQRAERNTSTERLGVLLATIAAPSQQVDLLLEIERWTIGAKARRMLGDYLVTVLADRATPAGLDTGGNDGNPAPALRRLRRWQDRIQAAVPELAACGDLDKALDGHAVRLIRERRLFETIARRHATGLEQATALIELAHAEHFTRGAATELVRQRLLLCLQSGGGLAALRDAMRGDAATASKCRAIYAFLAGDTATAA